MRYDQTNEKSFLGCFGDLITLDSQNCMPESVVTTVNTLKGVGKKQPNTFRKRVIEDGTYPVYSLTSQETFSATVQLSTQQVIFQIRTVRVN